MELANILIFVFGAVALSEGSITDQLVRFSAKGNHSQNRIIGGQPAEKGQFPHQVHLQIKFFNIDGDFWCGGCLIHPRWVISAAHCAVNVSWFNVLLGEVDRTMAGMSRNTSTFYIHPAYDPKMLHNDLVMIDLKRPVELSDNIRPIRLPEVGAPDYAGENCTMSGWGGTKSDFHPVFLRFVQLKAITNARCAVLWGDWVMKSSICAQGIENADQNACHGDSGGPLVYYHKDGPTLVGVFSFVNNYCLSGIPTGYVRPQYFLDWISSFIKA